LKAKAIHQSKSKLNWKNILIGYILYGLFSFWLISLYPSPSLCILVADIGSFFTLILLAKYLAPKALSLFYNLYILLTEKKI
jgi:hypothetical protein